jgi:nucleoside-diphosphate-sugar epimerase
MRILITDGTGFIGPVLVRHETANTHHADQEVIQSIFKRHRPEAVMHLAPLFGVTKLEWHHAMELCIDEVLEVP